MVLRWGFLGSGKIARDFACSMLAVDGSEIVSVASRRESDTLSKFAADFNCRSYSSYEAMANDSEVDIVYVATIHPTHHALAKMSLNAGKRAFGSTSQQRSLRSHRCASDRNFCDLRRVDVLVEKPFTMNHREATELVNLAAEKGLFLMEAMWTRFLPATIEALRLVSEGAIGQLKSAQSTIGGPMDAAKALAVGFKEMAGPTLEEQQAEKLLGDGIFLGAGVYALTIPNFFFRQEYNHDDSSLKMTATGTLNQAGVDVGGHYIIDYPNAGRALAHITREYPLPNETWLYGTAGQIRLNSTWGPSAYELNGELHEAPFMAPAPAAKGKWSGVDDATTWRSGLAHEIVECMECIGAGRTESPTWPLRNTLCIMRLMDDARHQLGVTYESVRRSLAFAALPRLPFNLAPGLSIHAAIAMLQDVSSITVQQAAKM